MEPWYTNHCVFCALVVDGNDAQGDDDTHPPLPSDFEAAIDRDENDMSKHAAQVHSAHFSVINEQATLHTAVIYEYKVDGLQSFTTVSDSLWHDAPAVLAYMQPVLNSRKALHLEITDLHFFSNRPTMQYRNKLNFFLLSTVVHEMGFEFGSWKGITWRGWNAHKLFMTTSINLCIYSSLTVKSVAYT